MPQVLDDDTVAAAVAGTGWERHGDEIVRSVQRDDFDAALAFVNQVGRLASERNHHPDITIRWNTVTLTLSTHSEGGITQLDLDLAAAIDALG